MTRMGLFANLFNQQFRCYNESRLGNITNRSPEHSEQSNALAEIEKATDIKGVIVDGKSWLLKEQVAAFFEVTTRTIFSYFEKYAEVLRQKGYEVLRGKRLKAFKLALESNLITKLVSLSKQYA